MKKIVPPCYAFQWKISKTLRVGFPSMFCISPFPATHDRLARAKQHVHDVINVPACKPLVTCSLVDVEKDVVDSAVLSTNYNTKMKQNQEWKSC